MTLAHTAMKAFSVLAVQALAHFLWYVAASSAQAQQVVHAVLFDAAYGVCTLFVYTQVLDKNSPKIYLLMYLLGGALGTACGVSVRL